MNNDMTHLNFSDLFIPDEMIHYILTGGEPRDFWETTVHAIAIGCIAYMQASEIPLTLNNAKYLVNYVLEQDVNVII